ncbi:hypothetical protein, variant [Cryptococcus amylolentus CBS 6039]|uniref:Threonine/serine exporter-like N-terminal domain-containing protein n=2 Tax=Cryptococcus amylolentus TaxID=104669 RepID=A0A1E3HAF2_9TREE|nr:hypothetical protein, variant [Cryptococcus amylolentus CBS 6039]ODN73284.1 hypothetical protein, variant [Cryptococcus amylolentus CBS 6039]ODN99089.1 hypothetical protein I350_07244 [Cryptococcus amylolentus CBS 6273]
MPQQPEETPPQTPPPRTDPSDKLAPQQATDHGGSATDPSAPLSESRPDSLGTSVNSRAPSEQDITSFRPSSLSQSGDSRPESVAETGAAQYSREVTQDVMEKKHVRPPSRKVHWGSRLGAELTSEDPNGRSAFPSPYASALPSEEDLVNVRRSLTSIFHRPSVDADSQHGPDMSRLGSHDVPSSAVSLDSYEGAAPPRRRQTSGRSSLSRMSATSSLFSNDSDWEDDDQEVTSAGVFSAMLGFTRNKDRHPKRRRRSVRSMIGLSDDEDENDRVTARKRWSTDSLFAIPSRASNASRGHSRQGSEGGDSTFSAQELSARIREADARVTRHKRQSRIPHRSEDLNQPYIPSSRYSNPIEPNVNTSMSQRFRAFMTGRSVPSTLLGAPVSGEAVANGETSTEENHYRSLAALMTTTNAFMGIGSPTLAHIAPSSGEEAESAAGHRRVSWYENIKEKDAAMEARDRQEDAALGLQHARGDNIHKAMEEGRIGEKWAGRRTRGKRIQKEMAVTKNVSNILQRKKFIELLAKAVVNYGAPAHSVEAWLSSTADILGVEASFVYFPTILMVAFRDTDVRTTDLLFIRPSGGLELYRLSLVHEVYRRVTHDAISAGQGSRVLKRIENKTLPYSRLSLLATAAVASGVAARVAFSGSFIDMLMSGVLGTIFTTVQFMVSRENRVFSNIFEIGMAGILSFIARGLGASKYFCYQSLASSAIVLILPGWHICLGALELGSRNIVAGAIRLVWAVVYTLFLSLGLGLGNQIWDAFGPAQPTYGDDSSSDDTTTVTCNRNPEWLQWWYTEPNDWWLFLLVPVFAYSLAIWFRADWKSKDTLVMVCVACAGYVVNFFLSQKIAETNVVSAVSAFAIGVLGNLYSRIGRGSAFPSMVVGILLIVPNAIAAAGGLGASSSGDSDTTEEINTAVIVSIRMVQVGIGLAIGLFAATVAVYPFGKRRRYIFSY